MGEGRLATDKKKALSTGAEIVFVDETGFSFRSPVARTWAPRGEPPVLRRVDKRRALSTCCALTVSGRILRLHFESSIGGQQMCVVLQHLVRQIGGAMILIWDGLKAHYAAVVKEYLSRHPEISIEGLPAYAPEINAEEYCHGYIKRRMSNAIPQSVEDIRFHVDREIRRLRRKPHIIQTFFLRAGLKLTD
jgi:transposase